MDGKLAYKGTNSTSREGILHIGVRLSSVEVGYRLGIGEYNSISSEGPRDGEDGTILGKPFFVHVRDFSVVACEDFSLQTMDKAGPRRSTERGSS